MKKLNTILIINNMAKPILVVRVPVSVLISQEVFNEIVSALSARVNDEYHILPLMASNIEDITFEMISEKDITEANYEELKLLVIDTITKDLNF